jgi:hypothetical protein
MLVMMLPVVVRCIVGIIPHTMTKELLRALDAALQVHTKAPRCARYVIRIDRKCSGARELGGGIKPIAGAVPIILLEHSRTECRGLNRLGIE